MVIIASGCFHEGNYLYSRRIGLNAGQEVDIDAGGRVTGRGGKFSIGVMNIQTDDEPISSSQATNFSVLRIKRDVLRGSSIGAMFTRRSISTTAHGANEVYGVDGRFTFFENLTINSYWATTKTPSLIGDDNSYRAQIDYSGDRYGYEVERLVVGSNFNPEVGFLRREEFERSYGAFRFSPRLHQVDAIRKVSWVGRFDYITDRSNVLETRKIQNRFGIEFENSDELQVEHTRNYEFLDLPFDMTRDVTIPVGGFTFEDVLTTYELGRQRKLSGRLTFQHGGFFGGSKTSLGIGGGGRGGRLELTPKISLEPGMSINWIDLPQGRFTTNLITTRITYTFTPLMFFSGFLQYNSGSENVSANLRFRWEYQPGSELFVVYNEQRDTLSPHFPRFENRSVIVKINRLFRF